MKIYFGGSIRGGRKKVDDYIKIVDLLKEYGKVLTEHIAYKTLDDKGEKDLTKKQIHDRDVEYLKESDLVVAETTVPSLGVGYELAYAQNLGKKVICLFDIKENSRGLSAMIEGNDEFTVINYQDVNEMLVRLRKELDKLK